MSSTKGKIQHSEKRFGVVAVEQGLITGDQLYEGLKAQVTDDLEEGSHRPLGEISVQQGVMTRAQVGKVVQALGMLEKVLRRNCGFKRWPRDERTMNWRGR
jgi:hypothetical protein